MQKIPLMRHGTLLDWTKKEIGKGIARGDTSNGFLGDYVVTYFYPDGSEAGTFDLKIRKTGPVYDLSYSRDGKLLFLGVGIDTSDGMAAGYRKVEEHIHDRLRGILLGFGYKDSST